MTRTWIALLEEHVHGADRCVPAQVDGNEQVVLVSWTAGHSPHPRARAIDPRAVGAGGPPMLVSWVELDRQPLFDAPEVLQARRYLLRQWPAYGASSLVQDGVRLAGSVLLQRPDAAQEDPFARLAPRRLLMSQDFFVPVPCPTGPALERYGGVPWPYDSFAE
jgi:hypothetical protein